MAVGVLQEIPFVTQDIFDAVNQELRTREDPPAGLIIHTAGAMEGGGFRIFDVWESAEAWERFLQDRLSPAIEKVSGGQQPPSPPRLEVYELHDLIKG